jgi:hypothetical protein
MRPGLFAIALGLAMSPVAAMAAGPPLDVMSEDSPSTSSSSAAPSGAPTNTKWYGAPMLVSDLLSTTSWGIAAGTSTSPNNAGAAFAGLAGFPYLLTSPVVHAMHGHGWRAVGSVLLRASLAAAGLVVGVGATSCNECFFEGSFTGAIVGVAVGGLVAMAIDDGLLAWEPPDPPRPAHASLRPPALQWLPTMGVAYDSRSAAVPTFGVAGSF